MDTAETHFLWIFAMAYHVRWTTRPRDLFRVAEAPKAIRMCVSVSQKVSPLAQR